MHFFIVPAGISLERAMTIDPDLDWRDLRRGKEVWIIQTWFRLLRSGFPVTMSSSVPATGIVVYHKEEQDLVLRRMPRRAAPVLVGVRGDFRSADAADFEVLQSGHFADERRHFFIPHWPQPGLIPRNPARGARVERIVFKGYAGNLAAELRGGEFRDFLARHDLVFVEDTVVDDDWIHPIIANWHDYHDTDVVLALRPPAPRRRRHAHKPASKLCNAWLAGVPAVLSPDHAFRELRQGPLDYLEVESVPQAQDALLRLKHDPSLYMRMVANGCERAKEYSVERVTAAWAALLFETVPRLAARHRPSHYSPARRRARMLARKAGMFLSGVARK